MKCKKCDNLVGNNFKFCNKCGESLDVDVKFKKNLDKKEDTENVDFFMVPTWRLVIFSILSFGFYSVYWFSKNFSAIKKRREARGKKTTPVFWGIFNLLTSEILFRELNLMKKESTGSGFKIHPALLGVFYFLAMIIGNHIFLSPFVFIITVLIFQAKLKKYQYIGLYNYKKAKFKWGELVIVLIGLLMFLVSFTNTALEMVRQKGTELTYEAMQETANEINKDLPKMIDSETRLDSTVGIKNSLTYKYTLINYSLSDLEGGASLSDMLRNDLVNSVCTTPEMDIFVKNKATLNYSYYDKNGVFIEQITINTGIDCEQ